jgi:hypothetical protein
LELLHRYSVPPLLEAFHGRHDPCTEIQSDGL